MLASVVTMLVTIQSFASASFEGYIKYEIDVKPLHPELNIAYLQSLYGTHLTTYYKIGKYKTSIMGGNTDWELYDSQTNKQYLKLHNKSNVVEYDGSDEKRELQSIHMENSSDVILGRNTKTLVIEYIDGSKLKYWYDPSIFVSPEQFEKLRFGYLNRYWETAKSPYLKYERYTKYTIVTHTATQIERTKLDSTFFKLK
ncbi:hypothetical protein OE749_17555 [Aestuariibacter sp. AA17]|uniref:Outer membrane lipoprotein-sorting protein n=1 Tax=Fluctibacter corallii TaxID=2984329 RepID=A0ABT3ACU9_9ALTE|nr:hypothetical protein [Aestuariibacter sp. AA17]MCV2886506.1 hypothetical protein [Aestuariibacter sp. AA17]